MRARSIEEVIAPSSGLRPPHKRGKKEETQQQYLTQRVRLCRKGSSGSLNAPFERLDGEAYCQERGADDNGHQNARLLGLLSDKQHPPGEGELATHLDGLPPEHSELVCGHRDANRSIGCGCKGYSSSPSDGTIARQKSGCTTQCCRSAVEEGIAAGPQKQRVKQGHANRPHEQCHEGHSQSQ